MRSPRIMGPRRTWIPLLILGISYGATEENNSTLPDYITLPSDSDMPIESIERTTILFSGFYLPSTAPPTLHTTMATDIPEELETSVQDVLQLDNQTFNREEQKSTTEPQEENRNPTTPSVKQQTEKNVDVPKQKLALPHAIMTSENEVSKPIVREPKLSKDGKPDQTYHLEKKRLVYGHPCKRDCSSGSLMTCKYKFDVEWYEGLSKACFKCPDNITDCYRPDCISLDGVQRPLIVVNRRFPGPSIEVCLGDIVEIELNNRMMAETTSIHWHGLHQKESPYMDGVPYVSQCPVMPKSTFVYRYTVANTGTHFWHSHSGMQRADGMFGALIVRTADDPHKDLYDEDLSEHVIQVNDWTHELSIGVFTGHHHSKKDNKPPTLLINGRGIFGEGKAPPASFTVQQGKKYRFRLINAGVLNCPIELSLDNHTIVAISSDGFDISPIEVESLVSYAGERWDFVLKANAPVGNYWMRFRGLMDCDERFTSAHNVAVLHYINSSDELPAGPVEYMLGNRRGRRVNPLNERGTEEFINAHQLNSLIPIDRSLKPTPDRRVILSYDFNPIENPHLFKKNVYGYYQVDNKERVLTPQLNHVSLALPPFPLLSQYSDLKQGMLCSQQNLSNCSKNFCECLNVIELNLGEVVELILIDIGISYDANHPFHLHGHAFRVVAMDRLGRNTTVGEVLELEAKGAIKRNLINPPLKDTVTVPDGGYTIVRFIADNPGYWMMHCHLEFHVELGMALIFQVGRHTDFPPVPAGFPRCGNYRSPAQTNENEVYWTYNTTNPSDGPFTLTNWWPLGTHSSAHHGAEVSFILNALIILYTMF